MSFHDPKLKSPTIRRGRHRDRAASSAGTKSTTSTSGRHVKRASKHDADLTRDDRMSYLMRSKSKSQRNLRKMSDLTTKVSTPPSSSSIPGRDLSIRIMSSTTSAAGFGGSVGSGGGGSSSSSSKMRSSSALIPQHVTEQLQAKDRKLTKLEREKKQLLQKIDQLEMKASRHGSDLTWSRIRAREEALKLQKKNQSKLRRIEQLKREKRRWEEQARIRRGKRGAAYIRHEPSFPIDEAMADIDDDDLLDDPEFDDLIRGMRGETGGYFGRYDDGDPTDEYYLGSEEDSFPRIPLSLSMAAHDEGAGSSGGDASLITPRAERKLAQHLHTKTLSKTLAMMFDDEEISDIARKAYGFTEITAEDFVESLLTRHQGFDDLAGELTAEKSGISSGISAGAGKRGSSGSGSGGGSPSLLAIRSGDSRLTAHLCSSPAFDLPPLTTVAGSTPVSEGDVSPLIDSTPGMSRSTHGSVQLDRSEVHRKVPSLRMTQSASSSSRSRRKGSRSVTPRMAARSKLTSRQLSEKVLECDIHLDSITTLLRSKLTVQRKLRETEKRLAGMKVELSDWKSLSVHRLSEAKQMMDSMKAQMLSQRHNCEALQLSVEYLLQEQLNRLDETQQLERTIEEMTGLYQKTVIHLTSELHGYREEAAAKEEMAAALDDDEHVQRRNELRLKCSMVIDTLTELVSEQQLCSSMETKKTTAEQSSKKKKQRPPLKVSAEEMRLIMGDDSSGTSAMMPRELIERDESESEDELSLSAAPSLMSGTLTPSVVGSVVLPMDFAMEKQMGVVLPTQTPLTMEERSLLVTKLESAAKVSEADEITEEMCDAMDRIRDDLVVLKSELKSRKMESEMLSTLNMALEEEVKLSRKKDGSFEDELDELKRLVRRRERTIRDMSTRLQGGCNLYCCQMIRPVTTGEISTMMGKEGDFNDV